jgi:hypothetical protein
MIPRNASTGHVKGVSGRFTIDSAGLRLYIDAMAEDGTNMFEHELKRL